MRVTVGITAATLMLVLTTAVAQTIKPKALSPAAEAKWVSTIKHHKTRDGATVDQVLAYAAKMRPAKFKVSEIGVGYNGATGEPDTVYIGYWIGAKRLPDDAYADLGYAMTRDGQVKSVPSAEVMTTALEGGRDTFLQAVDNAYTMDCHPDPDEEPSC